MGNNMFVYNRENKTTLAQFLNSIPDSDLVRAIEELSDFHHSGVLNNGIIRELSATVCEYYLIPREHANSIVEKHCYRMAAEKWAENARCRP
jgi:hypothetical protein